MTKLFQTTQAGVLLSVKLLALLFLGAVAAIPAAAAQDADRTAAFAAHMEQTKARLQLTPEQEDQVAPIFEDSLYRRLAILEKYGFEEGNRPKLSLRKKMKLGKEMKGVRKDMEKALSLYLTKDQLKEFQKIQKENQDRMREMIQ